MEHVHGIKGRDRAIKVAALTMMQHSSTITPDGRMMARSLASSSEEAEDNSPAAPARVPDDVKSRLPCPLLASNSTCSAGDKCPYSHDVATILAFRIDVKQEMQKVY